MGLFRFLILPDYRLLRRSVSLLALYHGKWSLKGVWTYCFETNTKLHEGIWCITQNMFFPASNLTLMTSAASGTLGS